MKSDEDDVCNQLNVVMLGSPQKSILFEKLCQAAMKYERHVHYQDVYYLTIDYNGKEELLEFVDPGLARTGGREMAIKRADLALLFYSALSLSSLHNLQTVKDDLTMKGNVTSQTQKKMEESNAVVLWIKFEKRMKKGQKWATELGPDCEFIILSSSQFADAKTFLETIVSTIRVHRKRRTRTFIKQLKLAHEILSPRKSDRSKEERKSTKSSSSSNSYNNENKSNICLIM
ncbi:unnamed protein product [Angiostrongylus costaricensis]|uniref:Ras-associating domain-containing protein n=1 Tax=Angiostrongylus costaricensis TaxID=334426 RepID=A0A0R3PRU0_ANGCS|nr:unnamed protein product [Angiostrongylus costaricensis]